ncbi:uncharacterized protein CLUP02_06915 [Colletotrichum lupini]|uniref:Secreted protein n=1 Tax=Colletotrichum lupini TaxID=145971 RepID=A0A9Q8WFH3_9PEZI|nr:uncharacterized protein CLUP02_06915 [Colletotrichum lupini]KAK1705756.1 hypothetical protein BDP67DRAFT_530893 [Colletotrichum lupini]UQC81429.1 hypothetical protein CLUP02_06915 [Colletotrichum lupini]
MWTACMGFFLSSMLLDLLWVHKYNAAIRQKILGRKGETTNTRAIVLWFSISCQSPSEMEYSRFHHAMCRGESSRRCALRD